MKRQSPESPADQQIDFLIEKLDALHQDRIFTQIEPLRVNTWRINEFWDDLMEDASSQDAMRSSWDPVDDPIDPDLDDVVEDWVAEQDRLEFLVSLIPFHLTTETMARFVSTHYRCVRVTIDDDEQPWIHVQPRLKHYAPPILIRDAILKTGSTIGDIEIRDGANQLDYDIFIDEDVSISLICNARRPALPDHTYSPIIRFSFSAIDKAKALSESLTTELNRLVHLYAEPTHERKKRHLYHRLGSLDFDLALAHTHENMILADYDARVDSGNILVIEDDDEFPYSASLYPTVILHHEEKTNEQMCTGSYSALPAGVAYDMDREDEAILFNVAPNCAFPLPLKTLRDIVINSIGEHGMILRHQHGGYALSLKDAQVHVMLTSEGVPYGANAPVPIFQFTLDDFGVAREIIHRFSDRYNEACLEVRRSNS
jgi:hypothetical protein